MGRGRRRWRPAVHPNAERAGGRGGAEGVLTCRGGVATGPCLLSSSDTSSALLNSRTVASAPAPGRGSRRLRGWCSSWWHAGAPCDRWTRGKPGRGAAPSVGLTAAVAAGRGRPPRGGSRSRAQASSRRGAQTVGPAAAAAAVGGLGAGGRRCKGSAGRAQLGFPQYQKPPLRVTRGVNFHVSKCQHDTFHPRPLHTAVAN